MPSDLATPLLVAVANSARQAGVAILSTSSGTDFHGQPTAVFEIASMSQPPAGPSLPLELSDSVDFSQPELLSALTEHLREVGQRLRNPVPNSSVTLAGLPILYQDFHWPFHRSVSGADTYIVHGTVSLADGAHADLHAKISASMTVTFAEIVPAPEQPYAEAFIYNAIRKTLDQGQLEMLKSGNRQPVPVTTRYYSRWQKKFFFTESTEESRRQFLLSKVFWLSGVMGEGRPVWIADPRDAQYLNTTEDVLLKTGAELKAAGLLAEGEDSGFAAATPSLMAREGEFRALLEESLAFTKPAFNEEMRAGHTNM